MPNIFQTVLVRRFLAHSLEILVTFAISLVTITFLSYILYISNTKIELYDLGVGNVVLESQKYISISSDTPYEQARYNKIFSQLYYYIVIFTFYYFVFTAFNFFLSFVLLYPKNGYKVSVFYRMFGFSHFDFGKKKLDHLNKSLKIIYREFIFACSIYGVFAIIALFNIQLVVKLLSNFMGFGDTIVDLTLTILYLFCIFVLPSLILSLITLKKSKGKQLFWDYISGVTMK